LSDARANAIYQAMESLENNLATHGIGLLVLQELNDFEKTMDAASIETIYFNEYPGTIEHRELLQFKNLF
jgi:hypothetical protein